MVKFLSGPSGLRPIGASLSIRYTRWAWLTSYCCHPFHSLPPFLIKKVMKLYWCLFFSVFILSFFCIFDIIIHTWCCITWYECCWVGFYNTDKKDILGYHYYCYFLKHFRCEHVSFRDSVKTWYFTLMGVFLQDVAVHTCVTHVLCEALLTSYF